GIAVFGHHFLRSTRKSGLGVAVLVADEGLVGVEAFLEPLGNRFTRYLGVLATIPDDGQRIESGFGVPPRISDDGDGIVGNGYDLLDAFHRLDLGRVETLQFAAEHRTGLDRGVEHARQLDVHAVDHLADRLVGGVETFDALADELPVLRVLERHVFGRLDLRRRGCDLSVGRRTVRRLVRDHAVRRRTLGRRYLPLVGRCLNEHYACRRAAFAHVILRGTDAAAAAGAEITPGILARNTFARCWIFGRHFRPVAFEFLGDHLRKPRKRALAHLRACDADDDGVVWLDDNPGVDFRRAFRAGRRYEWHVEAERQTNCCR